MIRHRIPLVCVAACVIAAFAANVDAGNSQQDKMTACNAEAKSKNLAGDDRKSFMKTCNADAKTQGLTGDARKQFMSNCLKGS